jgi:hypothetical protein
VLRSALGPHRIGHQQIPAGTSGHDGHGESAAIRPTRTRPQAPQQSGSGFESHPSRRIPARRRQGRAALMFWPPSHGPRLVHMPSEPSGSQRSPAVSSGRSFAQVAGAILRKQARGQNPDKDELPGQTGLAAATARPAPGGGLPHAEYEATLRRRIGSPSCQKGRSPSCLDSCMVRYLLASCWS